MITVSAPVARHDLARAPRPCRGRCTSRGRACCGAGRSRRAPRSRRSRPAAASSAMEFSASSTEPSVQTPTRTTRSSRSWRYSTSEMSSSSVDRPCDPAQGVPLGEVLLAGGQLGRRRRLVLGVAGLPVVPESSRSRGVADVLGGVGQVGGRVLVPPGGLVELGGEGEVVACVRHMPSRVGRPRGPRELVCRRRTPGHRSVGGRPPR